MRQEIINIYTFEELPEDTQEKVIEKNYDINVDYDWWDFIYDNAAEIGLKINAFCLDRSNYVDGDFILCAEEVAQNTLNNHGEQCETYIAAENFLEEWQPVFDDYMDEASDLYESRELEQKMLDLEDEFLKNLCEDYRIILEYEYEYLTSEEAIIETIKANEYEFYENGDIA